jgi:peptidoglycan/LPS O-acetylase OafA/YrhL
MSDLTPPKSERLPAIDGLRGFASLLVLFHHCIEYGGSFRFLVLPLGEYFISWTGLILYGYGGVDLFFVLSGFCLAYPIYTRPDRPFDVKRYTLARIRRIMPPYLAAIAILWVLALLGIYGTPPTTKQLILALLMVYSWGSFAYWTLTLEARWYVVFPFLALPLKASTLTHSVLLRRFGAIFLFAVGCCVVYVFLLENVKNELVQRLLFLLTPLPQFLPVFVAGIGVAKLYSVMPEFPKSKAVLYERWLLGLFVLAFVLMLFVTPPAPERLQSRYQRVIPFGLVFTSLLLLGLYHPKFRWFFGTKPMVFSGDISYSLYLVHLPIIAFMYDFTKPMSLPVPVQFFIYQWVVPGICIAVAFGFYWCFERPTLRAKGKTT